MRSVRWHRAAARARVNGPGDLPPRYWPVRARLCQKRMLARLSVTFSLPQTPAGAALEVLGLKEARQFSLRANYAVDFSAQHRPSALGPAGRRPTYPRPRVTHGRCVMWLYRRLRFARTSSRRSIIAARRKPTNSKAPRCAALSQRFSQVQPLRDLQPFCLVRSHIPGLALL